MADQTLIIKLGAAGDVVRTTTLVHVIPGEITWVTAAANVSLLPDHERLVRVMSLEDAPEQLRGRHFNLVISLDDELEAARLAADVSSDNLVGTYVGDDGKVVYTESAQEWFDMGLISRFGKQRADEIKMVNQDTYQAMLFRMIGREFAGEEYLLRADRRAQRVPDLVGIEARAGDRWPSKRWHRYDDLARALERSGYKVKFLKQRETLAEYISDIDECSLLITGDTLALHIGLALKLQAVSIFTCTSATEIHDYGRMQKVVSPRLNDAFYATRYVPEAVESITLEDVAAAVRSRGFKVDLEGDFTPAPDSAPLVYVVLVNWNGKEDTLACLASLGRVDYSNFKIVVVDNASEDDSVAAIESRYPDVRVVRNDANEMFARANNQGIEIALAEGAEYVLLLNNDTEVGAEFLRHMVTSARSSTGIGMVGCKIYYFDQPEVFWYAGGIVSLWRGLIAHRGIREHDDGQYDTGGDTGYITACCILVARECVETVGVLDDDYYMYAEDADWCYRARRHGFRVVYQPRAAVWHKVSSSSGGKNVPGGLTSFKIHHKMRSTLKLLRRYASWYHWITIPFFVAGQFLRAAWMMLRSGNFSGIGAMFSAALRRKS